MAWIPLRHRVDDVEIDRFQSGVLPQASKCARIGTCEVDPGELELSERRAIREQSVKPLRITQRHLSEVKRQVF